MLPPRRGSPLTARRLQVRIRWPTIEPSQDPSLAPVSEDELRCPLRSSSAMRRRTSFSDCGRRPPMLGELAQFRESDRAVAIHPGDAAPRPRKLAADGAAIDVPAEGGSAETEHIFPQW